MSESWEKAKKEVNEINNPLITIDEVKWLIEVADKEIARLREMIDRAKLLIYGNPMTSKDKGETYSDAVRWLKEYKALKENSDD